jgi:23S rRNA (cytosine1962-C5)-methyltransferase
VPRVTVNRRGRDRLARGHLWVFRSDVSGVEAESGEVVEVFCRKEFLGQAFYSAPSEISLRLITTEKEVVDAAFWRSRLTQARELRQVLAPTTTAYRWVHGESDGIPSLIVDRYGDCLVLQTLSAGTEKLKPTFVELLVELAAPRGILERNDQKVRSYEGLPALTSALYGEVSPAVPVEEDGIQRDADLWRGQKTGLFLDQRENHQAAARRGAGRALDVFCYEGGFSLPLARVCESVLAVDTSAEALARLRAAAERNGISNVETTEANAFDLLHDLVDRGESFDTVVLDPPAFAKNREAVPRAWRGYRESNRRAMQLLRPGGHLITSTCSYHVSETDFLNILASAAADARARMVLVEKRTQSSDHPILLAMPETHYLKCMILRRA